MSLRTLAAIAIFAGLLAAQEPDSSNLSVRPNSSKGTVKLNNGQIDAVRATLDLEFQLGPSLPGRLPAAFEWALNGWRGTLGGLKSSSIRPIEWPREVSLRPEIPQATTYWTYANDTSAAVRTVKILGESSTYIRISSWTTPNVTVRSTHSEIMNIFSNRGIPLPTNIVQYVIYATSDGTGFYVEGFCNDRSGPVGNPLYLGFSAVVKKQRAAYWSMNDRHKTFVISLYGDKISYSETISNISPYYKAILVNENKPTEWVELQIQSNGAVTVEPLSLNLESQYPHGRGMDQSLVDTGIVELPPYDKVTGPVKVVVSNSFNAPLVEVIADYMSASTNYPSPDSYEYNIQDIYYTGQISFVLVPASLTTKSAGGDVLTRFIWSTVGNWSRTEMPVTKLSIVHPNGLQEIIETSYDLNLRLWSGDEFFTYKYAIEHPNQNLFAGFYVPDAGFGFSDRESPFPGLPCESGIVRLITMDSSQPTVGNTVVISHIVPRISFTGGTINWNRLTNGTVSFTQPQHVTNILTYNTPNITTSSQYRGKRLVHAGGAEWSGSQTGGRDAYLFYSSAILQAQEIYGSGAPYNLTDGRNGLLNAYNWDPTSPTVEKTVTFDSWELKTWLNNTGDPFVYPNPVASKVTTIVGTASNPRLPVEIELNGDPTISSSRDLWGPIRFDQSIQPPAVAEVPPLVTKGILNPTYKWGDSTATVIGEVQKTTTVTRHWDSSLGLLIQDGTVETLSGTAVPILLQGAIAPLTLATTSSYYDDKGRQKVIQVVRGSHISKIENTYSTTQPNPQPSRVQKSITSPNLTAPNYNDYTYQTYTFGPAPHYYIASETNGVSGRTLTYERNVRGQVTKTTESPSGVIIQTDYDDLGRISKSQRLAKGSVAALITEYRYDVNGLWKEQTDIIQGKRLTTRTELDAFGRTVRTIFPDGSTQAKSYDNWGQLVAMTPVLKPLQTSYGIFSYQYDFKGRKTKELDPKDRILREYPTDPIWGARTSDGTTLQGQIFEVKDDRGYLLTEILDILGQRIGIIDEKGQVVKFNYDKYGNLSQTNNGGQIRSYTYNEIGWLLSRTEPEEGLTEFANFTSLGMPRLKRLKGRDGQGTLTVETTLDSKHRATRIISKAGTEIKSDRSVNYRDDYSVPNFITEAQMYGSLREDYTYDALGRLVGKAITDGSQIFNVMRELDEAGNVTKLTYPSGGSQGPRVQTWEYDQVMRPKQTKMDSQLRGLMIYDQVAGTSVTNSLVYGNGVTTQSLWDKGELIQTAHATQPNTLLPNGLQNNTMTWSVGGLLLTRGQDRFEYDALGRLSYTKTNGLNGEVAEQWFGFDRFGNRNYSDFTYSAPNGELKPNELLAWRTGTIDGRNGLPSLIDALIPGSGKASPELGTINGQLVINPSYDNWGRIVSVTAIPGNSATVTTWGYDPMGQVVHESVNGTLVTFLLDGEGLRFKHMQTGGGIRYTVYGFNREPLSIFEKSSTAVMSAPVKRVSPTKLYFTGHSLPAVGITISPSVISVGESATLTCVVINAAYSELSGYGPLGYSDDELIEYITVRPDTTTTYVLTAYNDSGSSSTEATLTVRSANPLVWTKTMIYGFGQLLCEENSLAPSITYIQSDQVGSPNLVTDSLGYVIGKTKNLPFGERFGQIGSKSFRRFATHEDQSGSAIYMQARTYLPVFGRFAQVDPLYDQRVYSKDSWNLYAYVANNPVTRNDPTGQADPSSRLDGEESNGDSPRELMRKEIEKKIKKASKAEEEMKARDVAQTESKNALTAEDKARKLSPVVIDQKVGQAYEDKNAVVGNGECVTYVKTAGNITVPTKDWVGGDSVKDAKDIKSGTVIMTADKDGKYPSGNASKHAAEFLGRVDGGFVVREQWAERKNSKGEVTREENPVSRRVIYYDDKKGAQNNGNVYRIVLVPN